MPAALQVIRNPQAAASAFDPARLAILDRLGEPTSAAAVARETGIPRQKVNYHLKLLETQGLVEFVEERRKGNCVERIIRDLALVRFRADAAGKKIATMTPEADVKFAGPEARNAFAEELSEPVARLVAKYHDETSPRGRTFRLLVGSYPKPRADAEPGDTRAANME